MSVANQVSVCGMIGSIMVRHETFEGTGEELVGRVASLGKRRALLVVLEEAAGSHNYVSRAEIHERLAEIMKDVPILPDHVFPTADFYETE